MEQHGISYAILIFLLFLSIGIKGQSTLGNRVIFSDNVIFGVQLPEGGSVRPGSGVIRTISGSTFSSFTHYQYGTTIRTNNNSIVFLTLDTFPDSGILQFKRNLTTTNGYGCKLTLRDRDDIGELAFSTGFLHDGNALLTVSINQSNSNLFFINTRETGKITVLIGNNAIGTFNQFGFQFPQYTTIQREAMQNVSPGTTIYNLTTGKNETWSGTAWQ